MARRIFEEEAGGRVPLDAAEHQALIRRSGAGLVLCGNLPAGVSGVHAWGTIYVSAALGRPGRRLVAMQLWARYLCWRDRGGPPVARYEADPRGDPYGDVAAEFEDLSRRADPLQPDRIPTLY